METVLSLLTAAATIIGIGVVFRSRQLSRPHLRIHFGSIGLERGRGTLPNQRPRRVIVYGVPPAARDYLVLPIAIGLENLSALPISAMHLQLEYPAECLLDESTIEDETAGSIAMSRLEADGRVARRFGSVAQITYDLSIVRSREKAVISEVVRVPRGRVPNAVDDRSQAVLQRRWGGTDSFLSAFQIRLYASSSNSDPVDMTGVVAVVLAHDEQDLTRLADALLAKSWEGRRLRRTRMSFLFTRVKPQTEFAELVFLRRDALTTEPVPAVDPTVLRNSRTALLEFNMPPWGLTGNHTDTDAALAAEQGDA